MSEADRGHGLAVNAAPLIAFRAERGWSREQMAAELGITEFELARIEKGHRKLSLRQATELTGAFLALCKRFEPPKIPGAARVPRP